MFNTKYIPVMVSSGMASEFIFLLCKVEICANIVEARLLGRN